MGQPSINLAGRRSTGGFMEHESDYTHVLFTMWKVAMYGVRGLDCPSSEVSEVFNGLRSGLSGRR
jgi:hypothetical protein